MAAIADAEAAEDADADADADAEEEAAPAQAQADEAAGVGDLEDDFILSVLDADALPRGGTNGVLLEESDESDSDGTDRVGAQASLRVGMRLGTDAAAACAVCRVG